MRFDLTRLPRTLTRRERAMLAVAFIAADNPPEVKGGVAMVAAALDEGIVNTRRTIDQLETRCEKCGAAGQPRTMRPINCTVCKRPRVGFLRRQKNTATERLWLVGMLFSSQGAGSCLGCGNLLSMPGRWCPRCKQSPVARSDRAWELDVLHMVCSGKSPIETAALLRIKLLRTADSEKGEPAVVNLLVDHYPELIDDVEMWRQRMAEAGRRAEGFRPRRRATTAASGQ